MPLNLLALLVSLIWLVSEVVLAGIRHSKKTEFVERDKFSLRILWITILISVSGGILMGVKGVGFMAVRYRLFSLMGLILIVSGLAVRWTAILTLKKYFTVDVSISGNHQIIQKGIYGIIRHPAYAGSLLSFLGLGLSFSNWLSTVMILIPIGAAFLYRIRVEEKVLFEVFGEEYINYCKTTKRLVPGIY